LTFGGFCYGEVPYRSGGRLHLKWGEAPLYRSKLDDTKKRFAIAAGLDLPAADKTQLAKVSAPHG
jgi:hypothetical protein